MRFMGARRRVIYAFLPRYVTAIQRSIPPGVLDGLIYKQPRTGIKNEVSLIISRTSKPHGQIVEWFTRSTKEGKRKLFSESPHKFEKMLRYISKAEIPTSFSILSIVFSLLKIKRIANPSGQFFTRDKIL